jgi:hypothetical protein
LIKVEHRAQPGPQLGGRPLRHGCRELHAGPVDRGAGVRVVHRDQHLGERVREALVLRSRVARDRFTGHRLAGHERCDEEHRL